MDHAACAQMKEYDIYVPLHNNDGSPIDPAKLASIKKRLVDHFGGLTHFPQENEGLWKVGSFTFRDRIVILRVLTGDPLKAQMFFAQIKKEIKQGFGQEDVLIVVRDVKTV
jgi:hypothetical protein